MTPKEPHRPVGAPVVDLTPLPMMGEHLDVEGTLRRLYRDVSEVKQLASETDLKTIENKLKGLQRWGGIVSIIFSAGVAYSVFMDRNATDDEVKQAIEAASIEHNGGVDPDATDPETHELVGHHPELQKAVEANTKAITEMRDNILPGIEQSQRKMDKRTEYQFELSRWEAAVLEAKLKRKPAPPKPERLTQIERDLFLVRD